MSRVALGTIFLGALMIGCGARDVVPEPRHDVDAASADGTDGAPIDLTGSWHLVITDQQTDRDYTGTLVLVDDAGALTGSVHDWSNGAQSEFSGTRVNADVRLDRTDDPPYSGFRSVFVGQVLSAGTEMQGTFENDPTASGGNSVAGPWTAQRLP